VIKPERFTLTPTLSFAERGNRKRFARDGWRAFGASAAIALILPVWGCASHRADDGLNHVENLLAKGTSNRVRWNRGSADDLATRDELNALWRHPIGADDAVQIALLNNRSLQATYEDLGIAQADLVQAGLLSNPRFFASARFPNQGPGSPDAEFSVAEDFLELFMVPLRKRIAADKLAVAERRVADAVLGMEREARVAFYTYQGRRQELALQKTILDAQQSSCDLARQQHKAGNISDLDLASEEASCSAAKLEVARTQFQSIADREEITRLMGMSGPEVQSWQAADKLPDMPTAESPLQELESLAIRRRMDLDAERRQTLVIARSLGLTEQFRLTGIEIGFDVERRDPTERYVTIAGPQLTVELPIFDQKQAQIARLQAEYRQGVDRIAALAVDIRSQVRSARDRIMAARQTAELYQDVVIPQRRQVTALSEKHYNAMLLGVDRWLIARQMEVTAYKEYIEAVRDYWIARSDLERAIGGRLPATRR
jgi:cobalt-zinc-cadmium efflux system outer membrane protein